MTPNAPKSCKSSSFLKNESWNPVSKLGRQRRMSLRNKPHSEIESRLLMRLESEPKGQIAFFYRRMPDRGPARSKSSACEWHRGFHGCRAAYTEDDHHSKREWRSSGDRHNRRRALSTIPMERPVLVPIWALYLPDSAITASVILALACRLVYC